jgi:transposase, IS5 family
LITKQAGKPTAGDLHGGFDAAGTGKRAYGLASEALPEETGRQRIGQTCGAARQSSTLPTDSSLLGDGVRVLTRVMRKVTAVAGRVGTQMRDRMRSVKRRILAIARASRDISEKGQEKRVAAYGKLLGITSRVLGEAKKFSAEIAGKVKRGPRTILQKAKRQLDEMIPRVQQVMRQTRQRVLRGDTRAEGKIVSVFEAETRSSVRGKRANQTSLGSS